MAEFTALERTVMRALAWELRGIVPDLAAQFAESRPGQQRNTGTGLFTQTIGNPKGPAPAARTVTGRYGTVHAMVGSLRDPIAFQVEVHQGRLVALHGDAYDQDTRAIDFASTRFDQVFTVDSFGRSIAFDPVASTRSEDARPRRQAPPLPTNPSANRSAVPASSPPRRQAPGQTAPQSHPQSQTPAAPPTFSMSEKPAGIGNPLADLFFGKKGEAPDPSMPPGRRTTLISGVWTALAIVVFVAWMLFDLPLFLGAIIAFWVGRLLTRPAALARIDRALADYAKRKQAE